MTSGNISNLAEKPSPIKWKWRKRGENQRIQEMGLVERIMHTSQLEDNHLKFRLITHGEFRVGWLMVTPLPRIFSI
jgi:hypothetical protein